MIAALYVESGGAYFGRDDCDPWDEARDARLYTGPHPVVAHPPCQRWGRTSEVHPIIGRFAETGDDKGCFAAALTAVRIWGGVIEHPKDSKAFGQHPGFSLGKPAARGWTRSTDGLGWICQVYQGHYGHFAGKGTWLYAASVELPELTWARMVAPAAVRATSRWEAADMIERLLWMLTKRDATPQAGAQP